MRSVILLSYMAGTLGLIGVIVETMLMSAPDGWAIIMRFDLIGEAPAELVFLLVFLAMGVVSFWEAAHHFLSRKR